MTDTLSGKRVAFLATDGYEDSELTSPWQAVTDAGATAVLVSPASGSIEGKNGHEQPVDLASDAADAADFDALVLPGGVVNADHLRMDEASVAFAKAFFAQHKPVGAICHAAWTLVEGDVVRGRTLTSAGTEFPAADDTRLCEVNTAFEGFGLGDVAETDWITLGEVAVTTPAEEIDPFEAACLIFALSRPALRDVALVQWASDQAGGERAAEAQAGWERGEEYPADLAAIMWGDAPRPDAARLSAALTTVRHLTALTPQPVRAGLLASAAWLSWALGRSTHAADYARQALAIDPSHGLAEIVASFIQASHLPSCAFEN